MAEKKTQIRMDGTGAETMPLFSGTPQTATAEKYTPPAIPTATQDEIPADAYKPATGPTPRKKKPRTPQVDHAWYETPPPVDPPPADPRTADFNDVTGWTKHRLNKAYPGDYRVDRDGSLIVRVSWTEGLNVPDAITEIKHLYPGSEIHSSSHSKETHSARVAMRVCPEEKDIPTFRLVFYLVKHQENRRPQPADFEHAGTTPLSTLQKRRNRVQDALFKDPTERHANPPKPRQIITQAPTPAAEPPTNAETPKIEKLIMYERRDINLELAQQAYHGTSMHPGRRADGVIREYIVMMENLNNEFSQYVTDENREELTAELERYRAGYIAKVNAKLAAQSRCMSTFITGPSNYPTRTQQKRHDTYGKRMNEQITYREKGRARLNKKYNPREIARAARIIRSDESDPISRLQIKLEKMQATQETYKAANRIVRGKKLTKAEKISRLQDVDGIPRANAYMLMDPDFAGRLGFPPYLLQNNNANMRRIKQRIAALEQERDREQAADIELENGVIIIENTDLTRLQIIFPGKPADEIRDALKARGFRWAPTEDAWQRLLNNNARHAVTELMDKIKEYE